MESRRASLRSLLPLVAMVQPADPGQFNHLSALDRLVLDQPCARSVLAKAIIGSVAVVIVKIGGEKPL